MIGLLFMSVCFLCLGIALFWRYGRDERREYILLYGKVIRYDRKIRFPSKGFARINYFPVFEYYYAGKTYQKRHRIPSYGKGMKSEPNSKYKIGDTVQLRVYKEEPDYAICNDTFNIRLPLYLGVSLVLFGAILFARLVGNLFFLIYCLR